MHIPAPLLFDLLHCCREAALATHATQLPGHPFASAVAFAPDRLHRPVFLLSRLAEHTHNLLADPRASLLLVEPGAGPVLQKARATLIGSCAAFTPDATEQARLLRYLPEAADYLALGDFSWFRLQPQRARYVGGFGRMGWLEADTWPTSAALVEDDTLLARAAALLPAGCQILGVDADGADFEQQGRLRRVAFESPASDGEALLARPAESLAGGAGA